MAQTYSYVAIATLGPFEHDKVIHWEAADGDGHKLTRSWKFNSSVLGTRSKTCAVKSADSPSLALTSALLAMDWSSS
ncbi:hypothetical protein VDGE_30426 [Verticillium dahliae]|uniref:Uncharacterized protein n=1 Tax=Verticillium dahliae TaxID=27337 RepID=A0A444RU55_VERDA|nr:hypothetical protein VDGE_30426 [Verticillium dahliae]